MRELILKMSMTLDGFVCGPAGEADWMSGADPQAGAWVLQTISNASLHIMGSRSFHDMAAYWPTSTLPFAAPMNEIPKAVFSKRGAAVLEPAATTKGLADALARAGDSQVAQRQPGADSWATACVAGGDLAEEIARLKAQDGKPIVAHGGARFARSLVARDLVDVYALLIHPMVLGQGLSIFSERIARRPLALVDSKTFPGGAVALSYRRA
jgi:dihydrofolate reductase